jgi:transcriptional regulator with XRE-family HTH domain
VKDTNKEKRLPVGAHLKRERELRDISLEEVSRVTRVRIAYLEALEQGRWGALPAEVYVRGYIRAYSRFLGLNAEEQIARYLETAPAPKPALSNVRETLGMEPASRGPRRAMADLAMTEPTPATSARLAKTLRAPRRVGFALVLVLLLIAVLTISVIYYMKRSGDSGTESRNPTTTETALFEVTG